MAEAETAWASASGKGIAMFRHAVLLAGVLLALVLPAGALADTAPITAAPTITATGTGRAPVTPKDRNNNDSIAAAVNAANKAVVPLAFQAAHSQAVRYAKITGLTLGSLQSVTDAQGGFGPLGPFGGPFGPGRYCGTVRRPIFKVVKGRHKLVGFKRVHRCFVPPFEFLSLSVTYNVS